MGYTVEVSFDIRVQKNVTEFKNKLQETAYESDCETLYFIHEMEGKGKKIQRNHCIFVVSFQCDQGEDIIYFLKTMRDNSCVYIESIYEDEGVCNLIHASPKYLQRMDKSFVKQYKKERRISISKFTELESRFLNIIKGK